jgi:subtilisin family serine protease
LINATSVWTEQIDGVNLTGKGETVCIIDSGVDFTHQDLIGKI